MISIVVNHKNQNHQMAKIIRYAVLALLLVAAFIAYNKYNSLAVKSVLEGDDEIFVEIPTNSSYDDVFKILTSKGLIKDRKAFDLLAEKMNYKKSTMRSGRFAINKDMSTIDMIRHLRSGKQAPVMLTFSTGRFVEDVIGKSTSFIESDSLELMNYIMQADVLNQLGYTKETLISMFIPNSYEVYWNITPRAFVDRMQKEHTDFWNKNGRINKAKALKMTPEEVYTLASIVERETLQNAEKKRIAGVYLNRLKKGMLLQADPTSVFATRDFGATRVTDYHTTFDSPYNTYKYAGLPPGPISLASIPSIDAVLNAEDHSFIYFCAKGDGSGYHNFARTLTQHNVNAKKYRANVKKLRNQ